MDITPTQPDHPYKAPDAPLTQQYRPSDQQFHLLPEPRKCQAGWGISWLTNAFTIFKNDFLTWIGIGVVYLVILMVTSFIPVVNIIASFISFVFIGGIIKGCHEQVMGQGLRFDHLFSAFSTHLMPLVILVLLYFVAIIIAIIPMVIIGGGAFFFLGMADSFSGGTADSSIVLMFLLVFLLVMLLIIPIMMALWFAPALIVIHDIEPFQAMKMSFKGCLKNLIPFLIFGLVTPLVLLLLAVFTLGIGLLAVFPIGMITYYTSYRDVWTSQPLSVA